MRVQAGTAEMACLFFDDALIKTSSKIDGIDCKKLNLVFASFAKAAMSLMLSALSCTSTA
jgi:hypothetical protein